MAGHSKWDNIKHKKAKEDARRGKIFTKLARKITIAAREGGGDPESNFQLRLAIEKAKEHNMPNDNIERAIKRGTGELEGGTMEEITYEGYGPAGVAIFVEAVTDNRNRTASDMRYIFSKHGGNLGEAGCVAWMFKKRGYIRIDNSEGNIDEDDVLLIALEAGAEDVQGEDGSYEVYTAPEDFQAVKETLGEQFSLASAEITMIPDNYIKVGEEDARKVMKLIDALEDSDDVQQVHANFDIPDEIMAEA